MYLMGIPEEGVISCGGMRTGREGSDGEVMPQLGL